MGNGILQRLFRVAVAEDEAANAAVGGDFRETLSGSIGRAAEAGKPWAVKVAQPVVNALAFAVTRIVTGTGQTQHCQGQAAKEAAMRAARTAAGLQ